jgi:hypothetical protein
MGDAGQSTLEERIRHYEQAVSDVDAISVADWVVLGLTGILLPLVCLMLGWLLGW